MRQSQLGLRHGLLGFWRQIAGFDDRRETVALVGAVAKRRAGRVPTPAKAHRRPPAQAERLAILVDNAEVALDAQRAVIENSDFGACQGILRKSNTNIATNP